MELFHEGGEEKNAGPLAVDGRMHLSHGDCLCLHRYLGSRHGETDLQLRAPGELCESLLREDPLHGPHRDIDALVREELADLTRGETLIPPDLDLLSHIPAHSAALYPPFGDGLREVYLSVEKLIPQEVDVGNGVTKALSHELRGETLYKGGPECFIAPLPVGYRTGEIGRITHAIYIYYDAYNVNTNIVKIR